MKPGRMGTKSFVARAILAFLMLLGPKLFAADNTACDVNSPIVFAGLDWDSARFHNAVARYILEKGYGCRTDAIPGSTLPLVAGLIRGDVHVNMEIWPDLIKETWEKAKQDGKVAELGVNFPDAVQGWYVPRYVVEGDAKRGIKPMAPALKEVSQLPKYKKLFKDPEEPGKGRFYNCILGWACEVVNTKKIEVYGLAEHYTNFRPGASAALAAAIAAAYQRGKPILAYYWGPTWVMGTYDLIKLKEPAYDPEIWSRFMAAKKPRQATDFPMTKVLIGYNIEALKGAKQIKGFLRSYESSSALTNEALAYLKGQSGAQPKDAAVKFLEGHEDIWQKWVPKKVRQKVKASLAAQ